MAFLRFIIVVIVTAVINIAGVTNPAAYSREDVAALSAQLFEFGAVRFVHALDNDHIAQEPLFDVVASGQVLDTAQSCTYRTAYLAVLQDHAGLFQAADNDLQMATDYGVDTTNNCDGSGILGTHDLHDMSAKTNFAELVRDIDALTGGAGWFRTIWLINELQKDLIDLTVHMAPATHSIGINVPEFVASGPWADQFNAMQSAFKAAQFSDINSSAYWGHVDRALTIYADIVFAAQKVVMANSTALQRRLAGRWLSVQTVAPRLKVTDCLRVGAPQYQADCV